MTQEEPTAALWLPVSAAAAQTGRSTRTIRRYILCLPNHATRRDASQTLLVHMPTLHAYIQGTLPLAAPDSDSEAQPDATQEPAEASAAVTATEGHEPASPVIVEALQAHIQSLERQLEAYRVAESELRRLMLSDRQEIAEMRRMLLGVKPEETPAPEQLPALTLWEKIFGRKGR